MKIYISGKITGLQKDEYLENFKQAQVYLESLGHQVINPCELNTEGCECWEDFMICDIKELFKCKAIYMLDNWKDSKGARVERAIAKELGLCILNGPISSIDKQETK